MNAAEAMAECNCGHSRLLHLANGSCGEVHRCSCKAFTPVNRCTSCGCLRSVVFPVGLCGACTDIGRPAPPVRNWTASVRVPLEAIGPHEHRWQTAPSDVQRHCSECFLDQTRLGVLYEWPTHDPVCAVRRARAGGTEAPSSLVSSSDPLRACPSCHQVCVFVCGVCQGCRTRVSTPGDGKTYAGGAMGPVGPRNALALPSGSTRPASPLGPVNALREPKCALPKLGIFGLPIDGPGDPPWKLDDPETFGSQPAAPALSHTAHLTIKLGEATQRANALAYRCQTLEDDKRELLAENAELRRKVDRLERKR